MNNSGKIDNEYRETLKSDNTDWLFRVFCLWTIILVCRPQDLFQSLAVFRPAMLGAAMTLGLFLLKLPVLRTPRYFDERQIRRYLALVALMIIGIPFSLYARLSFEMVFTIYINVIVFVLIFYKVVNNVKRLSQILVLCCIGSGLYAAFSVMVGPVIGTRLTFGEMFDPNDLAFFILAFMPINLVFISKDNPLWIRLVCSGSFGVGIVMIVMTGSRGGMLAFAISAILMLVRKTRTITSIVKALFVGLCLIIMATASFDTERYMTIFSIQEDYNIQSEEGRLAIWRLGLRTMINNPFTGVGVEQFAYAIFRERQAGEHATLRWQTAHNSAIQIGTETGLIGLYLYLAMSFSVFKVFLKGANISSNKGSTDLQKICEMGIIGFAGLFISGMFLSQAYSVLWAYYIGFSAIVNHILYKIDNRSPKAISGPTK